LKQGAEPFDSVCGVVPVKTQSNLFNLYIDILACVCYNTHILSLMLL